MEECFFIVDTLRRHECFYEIVNNDTSAIKLLSVRKWFIVLVSYEILYCDV